MSVVPESGSGAGPGHDGSPVPPDSYLAARDDSKPQNKPAAIGFVLGIVSLVVNPILLAGLGAVVFAGIGLNRASLMGQHGYAAVGKGKAIGGIVLGLLGTIASVLFKGGLF